MLTQYKNILRIALIVGIILLIPLVLTIRDGGVEGVGWNWTAEDFLVMGGLLFVVGLAINMTVRKLSSPLHRGFVIIAIVLSFLAVWAELAVDAVSKMIGLFLN